jgi:hypothetical protein
MQKKLLNSEDECVQFLLLVTREDFRTAESLLGIEFAHTNGEFLSDFDKTGCTVDYAKVEEIEKLDVDTSKWRKMDENDHGLPTEFPCVAVYSFDNSFDRFGKVSVQILDFVYQSDFRHPKPKTGFVIYYPDTKTYNMASGFEVPFEDATLYNTYEEALETSKELIGDWEIVNLGLPGE